MGHSVPPRSVKGGAQILNLYVGWNGPPCMCNRPAKTESPDSKEWGLPPLLAVYGERAPNLNRTNRELCSHPRLCTVSGSAYAGHLNSSLPNSAKPIPMSATSPPVRNKSCLPHRQKRTLAIMIASGSRTRDGRPRSSSDRNRKPGGKRIQAPSHPASNRRANRVSCRSHGPSRYAPQRSRHPSAASRRRRRRSRRHNSRASGPG